MIFGERFYPTLQKMPPWRHSLFALALATRAYPNFALWCDIKEQQGKREYLHALKQCWRFHYDKYNHVDLEAAYDIIEPLMPMELEEYSEGDSFAFDASVILDVALESVPFNSKNAKNASMASMASVIRLCENTNPEESDDEEKLLELDPIQAEIDFQVAVMEMVMEPRSAEVVKKLLELSLESKCSNIGIESDLTMDDFAESLVQTELSEEELAKRKGAVDPWGANKQANDDDDDDENDGEDELVIEEGSDLDGDNEVANSKEELNTSDEQVANEQLSDEKIAKQKIADDESTTEITADEDYSNIDPSEFDEDLELLEEECESDEAFGDIVLVEDEDGVLTDMTAPFEGDADEEDDNKSNKHQSHRQERRKDHRDSPRREDRRFDRHPRRDREDGEGRRRDRKFGDRPHGDRPHGDRDRKFGDRPRGDRPHGDRPFGDRKFGDRPRGDRPFGDRDRKFGDRPNGDRPHGDRKFGDRPRGDRPFGDRDRKFGDRPRGDRPFGDRDRKFGDRPRGDRPFGDRDRNFGDRPHGDRKFGDRQFGDRKGRGGKFGERNRHGEAPQKPRVFGPKSN